jgi:TRAP-type C4-dicarboxylate transport system substrate-binding protein
MQSLPEDEQEIIREAASIAKECAREQSDARIASRIETIEESGSVIVPLDDEMHEELRELSRPVYDAIEENVSKELIDAYLNL